MRVLVSGYYGAGNLGDEALLAGLVAGLTARGIEPVVLSVDPRSTRELHGVAAVDRYSGLLPALVKADALVSGGGGLLQDVTSGRSLSYYLGALRLAKAMRKRVVVYGQSLGPFTPSGLARTRRALAGVPLALRDQQSVGLAASMGYGSVLVADPALVMPLPPGMTQTDLPADRRDGPVVLAPRGGQDALNGALATLAGALQADGVPLAAVAFQPRQDEQAVAELIRAAPSVVARQATTPAEALAAMAGARYVVSVRLHGCILAARLGIGFAGLSYDPKVKGFLSQAAAPAFTAPVDGRALLNLVRAAPPAAAHAVDHLTRLADEGLDWLAATLGGTA